MSPSASATLAYALQDVSTTSTPTHREPASQSQKPADPPKKASTNVTQDSFDA
jgi:hypothetical protein